MLERLCASILGLFLSVTPLHAQEVGTAAGEGKIDKSFTNESTGEISSTQLAFSPHYAFAYADKSNANWLVLSENKPPLQEWLASSDPVEARRIWCEREKTPFVAVKFESGWGVDLFFQCPADGSINTAMVSTINGLASVVVDFSDRSATHLKGTLKAGEGNCPDLSGKDMYCNPTGDFSFDAPFIKAHS